MVEEFYLYILMRNDMDSLNPGKAVAQGAHAAHVFARKMSKNNSNFKREFKKWESTLGYGTVITKEGTEAEITLVLDTAINEGYDECGWIEDPTYPLRDGKVTHYFPCLTCAYIFAPRGYHGVRHLQLMK
jgi:peptidyl-tRNA hydrolase